MTSSEQQQQRWVELRAQFEEMFPRPAPEPTRERKTVLFLTLLEHVKAELDKQNAAKVVSIERGWHG